MCSVAAYITVTITICTTLFADVAPAGFCGRMDCPRYTAWQKSPDFQIREYDEGEGRGRGRGQGGRAGGGGDDVLLCWARAQPTCLANGRPPALRCAAGNPPSGLVPMPYPAVSPSSSLPSASWVATNVSSTHYELAVKAAVPVSGWAAAAVGAPSLLCISLWTASAACAEDWRRHGCMPCRRPARTDCGTAAAPLCHWQRLLGRCVTATTARACCLCPPLSPSCLAPALPCSASSSALAAACQPTALLPCLSLPSLSESS